MPPGGAAYIAAMLDALKAAAPPATVYRQDYRPPDWLVPDIALEFELGAERTYLTHLTHDNRHADLEAELPLGIAPAFDGLTIRID